MDISDLLAKNPACLSVDEEELLVELAGTASFTPGRLFDARAFDPMLRLYDDGLEAIVEDTVCRSFSNSRYHSAAFEACSALFGNLLAATGTSGDDWVRIRKQNGSYRLAGRYGTRAFGSKIINGLVDGLHESQALEVRNGFYNRANGQGYQTRIRLRGDLKRRVCDAPGERLKRLPAELIVLKNEDGRKIDYKETAISKAHRALVMAANEFLDHNCISPPGDLSVSLIERLRGYGTDPTRGHYHRVFNGTFELGGRFFGPWWQQTPSAERLAIKINGEPVVELDFQAMNLHLAYSLAGSTAWDRFPESTDPYMLPGYKKEHRTALKMAFLFCLNSKSPEQAVKVIRSDAAREGYSIRGLNLKAMVAKIRSRHPCLDGLLFGRSGLKLMALESRITERILSWCLQREICSLNIHDGYVVPASRAEELCEGMRLAFDSMGLCSIPDIHRESLR